MTLLHKQEQTRREYRERLRIETLAALKTALGQLLPGQAVYVFGSLIQPGRFHQGSDVDIALLEAPQDRSLYRLQAEIEEMLGRPVDLVILRETRLRRKIEREGELWTS